MSDVRTILERGIGGATPPPDGFERMLRRRDRRRRHQRITAGVVGIAIFVAAVWIVTNGGLLDQSRSRQRPATLGPTSPVGMPPVATAPWVSKGGNPNVDYVLDLETGSMTPLPQTILESLGEGQVRRYEGTVAAHDGLRLAYVGQAPDGSDQIFVANLDGTGIQQVTSDPAFARSPAWSPDGTKIAYSGHTANRGNGLFVVDLDSGQTTEVVDETDRWATPQFTPDGASLLFTGGTDMQPLLFTVPIASGQKKLLFEPGEGINDAGNGSISPDGSLVTYIGSGNPNPGGVGHCGPCRFVANVDGTGRRLIAGWMINAAGAWSPDGKRIVSMDDVGPTHRPFINVVDIATGHGTKVGYGRAAIWLDDHTLLVEVLGRR